MITFKAYAKLNLSLSVLGKRDDGYHELDMIMQSISLFDTVRVKKADDIRVSMDDDIVGEKDNTAYKAAKAFCEYTGKQGASISIQKAIPSRAGLGGSSADAAAVLVGLNRLYKTNLYLDTLQILGKRVGADVPFSLFGGTARAKGVGEKLTSLNPKKHMHYVLVKPHQGVSTAEAFSRYRESGHISMDSISYAVQKGDVALFLRYAKNVLGMAALSIAPDILKASGALIEAGAKKAFMTGSGSCMFAVFQTIEEAKNIAQGINGEFELCGAFSPKNTGVEIVGEDSEQI